MNARLYDGVANGRVDDDDPMPAISLEGSTLAEGDLGQAGGAVAVSLSAVSGRPVTVRFETGDGTAVAGADYEAGSGAVTIPPGSPGALIDVFASGDTVDEVDETFVLKLSHPSHAMFASSQGVVIIDDDDGPVIRIGDATVQEGDAGTTTALFPVTLTAASVQAVSFAYSTADGTALAVSDYQGVSGSVTIPAGSASGPVVSVAVNGDVQGEPNETFRVLLSGVVDANPAEIDGLGHILDDDRGGASLQGELQHGAIVWGDLTGSGGGQDRDLYLVARPPRSSFEVVVDAVSGDLGSDGPALERLAGDLSTVLQMSTPVGTGSSRSLRFEIGGSAPLDGYVSVRSLDCTTDCGADDVYRLRSWETTLSASRFNNAGGQVTVLMLQNAGADVINGHMWFWSPGGALLASAPFTVGAKALHVLNTGAMPGLAGRSGSITVSHDGSYAGLSGKTVALDPTTGFSFDTPLINRPR